MSGQETVRMRLVGLEFNSPVNIIKFMFSRSIYLTSRLLGRLSPPSG